MTAFNRVYSQEHPVDGEGQAGGDEAGRGECSQPRLPSDRAENKPGGPAVIAAEPFPSRQREDAA